MFNKQVVLKMAEKFDSFYIYDEEKINTAIENLQCNFKNAKFLYSVKTNPNKHILKCVTKKGFGVDAASANEAKMAKENGVEKINIQYSAPGKREKDIKETIDFSIIIADSLNEINLIQKVAKEMGIKAKIGIRLNPEFSFGAENGVSSKFGIDEKQFLDNLKNIQSLENVEIIGLHIHIKSQELNASLIENYHKKVLDLAIEIQNLLVNPLEFINMGSGIGITYELTDTPIDIKALGEKSSSVIKKFNEKMPNVQVYIETGRYIAGKSGVYATKVLDKKISYGKTYVILHNTLNGFIRPVMATIINNYNENPAMCEPFYTTKNPAPYYILNDSKEKEVVNLVGNLCTSTDVVADNISLTKMEIGDIVVFTNAGSYSAVLTPMQFSSQEKPVELFLNINGELVL